MHMLWLETWHARTRKLYRKAILSSPYFSLHMNTIREKRQSFAHQRKSQAGLGVSSSVQFQEQIINTRRLTHLSSPRELLTFRAAEIKSGCIMVQVFIALQILQFNGIKHGDAAVKKIDKRTRMLQWLSMYIPKDQMLFNSDITYEQRYYREE